MHWIDWLIVIVPLLIVAYIGWRTQRYVKGVSDFLAASRVAGRYVVAVAGGEAAMGLISVVAMFEAYAQSGFAYGFWSGLAAPVSIVILLTGFAIYRYRETRAMTLSQFFEVRYSKSFRIFTGILQSISGIINYGLFPAVGARFIIYYCNLPLYVHFLGLRWPTFALTMMVFLSLAVLIVTMGGQITAMTTDCVQGILSYPMYMIVVVAILYLFSWHHQMEPTLMNQPPGKSMLNPFDIEKLQDFNLFYVLVGVMGGIYNMMSWSGLQGYNAAAATPHEQKMGRILGTWRSGFSGMMFVLLAVAGYTYMHHVDFADRARVTETRLEWMALNDIHPQPDIDQQPQVTEQLVKERVDQLNPKEAQVVDTISNQMRIPVALRDVLPVGVTGVFCALMIFLMVSTDVSYLHSWGSILVQDVVLPFRKKPFTPRQQLMWLRLAITFVAVFAFFFSIFFGQVTYILMFFALTGSIWLGGAGAVILGGLYWKKGTAAGAWAALLLGSGLAVLSFIGQNYWVNWIYPLLDRSEWLRLFVSNYIEGLSYPFEPLIHWRVTPERFPINGQEIYFLTMVLALAAYVAVSLLTCREDFNMDRMLHRGEYRREGGVAADDAKPAKPPRSFRGFLRAMLGIDDQFTRGDKILSWSVLIWSMGWGFGSWVMLVVWNAISPWPDHWWANWFFISNVIVAGALGIVSTVWFFIGGVWDLNRLFKRLATQQRNLMDDGRVMGHVNVEDLAFVQETSFDQQALDEEQLEAKMARELAEDAAPSQPDQDQANKPPQPSE